ncbi:DinB family protein [Paenibacillus xylanilyticus]|nr:DinB family protein [Paenibacillus xylanilyticus]
MDEMTNINDLSPDPAMTPVVGLLHAMVNYNDERLIRLVKDMSAEELQFKGPAHDVNSTAQLLRHISVVLLHWVFRLQSQEVPAGYTEKYGPMFDADGKLPLIPDLTIQTWLQEHSSIREMFRSVCLSLQDHDLERVVPYENGEGAVIRWSLFHIADHCRHHYAHIVYLRRTYSEQFKG